ncbi:MAG: helix-turn-helix transcriptional regulator [Cyanobacteria bacterium J06606_4]
MKAGSKYYPLFEYLQQYQLGDDDNICLTFAKVEAILQQSLPASATKRAWWSNRDSNSALQAGAWIQAGYHVAAVDFEQQRVTFSPFQAEYTIRKTGDAIVWDHNAIKALRKHMGYTQAKFADAMGVRRQTVSEWENGVYEPDRSTAKHLALIAEQATFLP